MFMICTAQIFGEKIKKNEMKETCRGRGEEKTGLRWGILSKGYCLEVAGVHGMVILKLIFKKCDRGPGLD